jgi:succinate dehydrogenase hydrophobic anchor subunit
MNLKRISLKICKVLLYVFVLVSSGAMGAGIDYLYSEISGWFLFLILAAIIIAMSLLFGARIIIEDYINPRLEQ